MLVHPPSHLLLMFWKSQIMSSSNLDIYLSNCYLLFILCNFWTIVRTCLYWRVLLRRFLVKDLDSINSKKLLSYYCVPSMKLCYFPYYVSDSMISSHFFLNKIEFHIGNGGITQHKLNEKLSFKCKTYSHVNPTELRKVLFDFL